MGEQAENKQRNSIELVENQLRIIDAQWGKGLRRQRKMRDDPKIARGDHQLYCVAFEAFEAICYFVGG